MSKNRDRAPRGAKHYDSDLTDDRSPEPVYFQHRPAPTTHSVEAEVKWFNAEKGFGFVKLAGGAEAYLHISALKSAGHESVSEGARLTVTTEPGQKGPQVAQVLTVGTASQRPSTSRVPTRPDATAEGDQESTGAVKWYNSGKGFGFVGLDVGGEDVFVHASTLTRSGLTNLVEGQKVFVRYTKGQRGLEAQSIHPV
ncbi:CspA family cold shock protein (plasmid) [Mesorhizobium sp. AR02]|uniref:cold-shock protein n=1 Tax=Mesorhizobium sp. AR02 TaxID=2865837 RepID=UPI0021F9ED0C|nr:cold-shock protein [Mesorhizobium sp. AR02]UVK57295.1 CspA family cold shock protein [Mesorhizobium sp. AR02]